MGFQLYDILEKTQPESVKRSVVARVGDGAWGQMTGWSTGEFQGSETIPCDTIMADT